MRGRPQEAPRFLPQVGCAAAEQQEWFKESTKSGSARSASAAMKP